MARIGLLTCSNATQDLGCCSHFCLEAISAGGGTFTQLEGCGAPELVGIINCSGCPTLVATDRLLGRVRALAELDVDAIYLSSCLAALCPYSRRYRELIEQNFPEIRVVLGTHGDPEDRTQMEMFREAVHDMLCQPQTAMIDLIKQVKQTTQV